MNTRRSILLKDLNSFLTCPLCLGYFIDATTLVDCMHSFCKSCILKHFENNKIICPTCNTACKRKENLSYYKQDMPLQTLVYKLVPGLYAKEIQRREDFYRTAGVRASSSCSDDSVIGDNMQEHEEWIHTIGDENQFLSPDDSISLSLEYYQQHLDNTSSQKTPDRRKSENADCNTSSSNNNNSNPSNSSNNNNNNNNQCSEKITESVDNNTATGGDTITDNENDNSKVQSDKSDLNYKPKEERLKDRRYLQCPAAVPMTHLQKFIRMKYALSTEHKVDIIHEGEVLPCSFTLMDVAYTFKWKRVKPMRFFYRIFTPMKIRPIRIINTSSSGQKQLQIVQVNPNPIQESKPVEAKQKSPAKETTAPSTSLTMIENEENSKEKERLMAELQLQSKAKLIEQEFNNSTEKNLQNSRYGKTYERNHDVFNAVTVSEKRKRNTEESDKINEVVEKKRKVEKTEAVSSKLEKKKREIDEDSTFVFEYNEQDKEELKRFAEKRDREWQMIKHSEDEPRPSKKRKKNKHSKGEKRKLHAEITSEVSNKQESIKLKVKLTPHNGHKHKHHKTQTDGSIGEMSNKEKLRQMRQIRHKMINVDDKVQRAVEDKPKKQQTKGEYTVTLAKTTTETQTRTSDVQTKSSETQTKSSETQTTSKEETKDKAEPLFSGKTLRSDFIIKTTASKELCSKQAVVQTERLEQIEKLIPKHFSRMVYSKSEKQSQSKVENTERKLSQSTKSQQQISLISVKPAEIKMVDPPKAEKKVKISTDKPRILNSQYPAGFTVSKVEAGVKKKEVDDSKKDKRPSLEITLINPPAETPAASTVTAPKQSPNTTAKRPLPATIPLERIKSIKAITTLSGISIIPKVSEKCDNIGALDLSKPNRSAEAKVELNKNGLNPNGNGLKPISTSSTDKGPLSNLQMLSKVATEHPNINKPMNVQNKSRAQMPSLQNIKVPNLSNSQTNKPTNLAKLPKLNEISKGQFRMTNSPRTMRPNQNQSIRNIPNPSLLVRQQNQNRMNSLSLASNSADKDAKSTASLTAQPDNEKKQEKQKAADKCDIPVSKT